MGIDGIRHACIHANRRYTSHSVHIQFLTCLLPHRHLQYMYTRRSACPAGLLPPRHSSPSHARSAWNLTNLLGQPTQPNLSARHRLQHQCIMQKATAARSSHARLLFDSR
ncbi:hypothetical protein CRV24_006735 [Beauveria bassiana]|nr:hypothetical protein CRV24_006735 [Beauveria bassiana]